MRTVNQRLAARAGTRQVEVVVRADRAINAVSRAAQRAVSAICHAIEQHDARQVAVILRALPETLRAIVRRHLADTAMWSYRSARHHLSREVPYRMLQLAVRGKHVGAHGKAGKAGRKATRQGARRRLAESEGTLWDDLLDPWRGLDSGLVSGDADTTNTAGASLSDLLDILFPPPTLAYAQSVVYQSGWESRIRSGSGLADPTHVAHRVAVGLSLGHTPAQIEREIRPVVGGVVSSAKRLARTETMRVAARVQMDAHKGLGDLVVGYQIHATLDERTRPEHRARDGTIYWAEPKAGQLGYDKMPQPPMEADGTVAWGCRCFLVPVLAEPTAGEGVAKMTPAPTPDQLVYSDWFASTTERKRRLAVGSHRYDAVRELSGEDVPGWEQFVDVESGKLLDLEALRAEDIQSRRERLMRARATLGARRAAKADVIGRGYTRRG